jgi:hypothetical protein
MALYYAIDQMRPLRGKLEIRLVRLAIAVGRGFSTECRHHVANPSLIVGGLYLIRSSKDMATVSPILFPIAWRMSARTGNLCVPSPRAMNELRNGWPSILPLTFTKPRVPKNLTESGQTTYVQPPFWVLFCNLAENSLSNFISEPILFCPNYNEQALNIG